MFQEFLMENLWFQYFKHKNEEEETQALAKAKPVCCTYYPCVTGIHPKPYTVDYVNNQIVSPSGINKYTPRDDDAIVNIELFDDDRFGN